MNDSQKEIVCEFMDITAKGTKDSCGMVTVVVGRRL